MMNIRQNLLCLVAAGGVASSLCLASPEESRENAPLPGVIALPSGSSDKSPSRSEGVSLNGKAETKAEGEKEEGISTSRKIAGYSVLGFLLVWMFIRSGKNKLEQEVTQEPTKEEGEQVSPEDSSNNSSESQKN